jgi:hypothetical protein
MFGMFEGSATTLGSEWATDSRESVFLTAVFLCSMSARGTYSIIVSADDGLQPPFNMRKNEFLCTDFDCFLSPILMHVIH